MKAAGWTLLIVVAVVAVIGAPYAVLWALNRLFATGLGYGLLDWLAALVLIVTLQRPSGGRS